MRKLVAVTLCLLMLAGTMTACTSRPTYGDGVYFAAGKIDGYSGYRTLVTVTVKDGNIHSVDWNELHYTGEDKKSLGDAYGMKMASAIGKEWYEQARAVEDALVKRGPKAIKTNESGNVTSVSGASIGVKSVMAVFETAMASGPVSPGQYVDGIYYAVGEETEGYQDAVTAVVANGSMVWVSWDKLAVDPAEGEAATLRMQSAGGEFDRQAADWEEAVLKNQSIEGTGSADILLKDVIKVK